MTLGILALIGLSLASLLLSGMLFSHKRLLTYLATSGALFETVFLLLTLINRGFFRGTITPAYIYLAGAILLLIFAFFYRKNWNNPIQKEQTIKDGVIVIILAIVATSIYFITNVNGPQRDFSWILHGFYNGDTATLVSITQKSFYTGGLVHQNPFSANGALEYPTLLHGAIASFFELLNTGLDWIYLLPAMTYIQAFLTVPLFFLLFDTVLLEPRDKFRLWFGVSSRNAVYLVQGVLVLVILGTSWDNYIFPQSHFFLTGIVLLQQALIALSISKKGWQKITLISLASIAAVVLLLTNAIFGTVAAVSMVVIEALNAFNGKSKQHSRVWSLIAIIAWILLFHFLSSGETQLGRPHFSISSAYDLLRLAPITLLLAYGLFTQFSRHQYTAITSSLLMLATLFIFLFSTRQIIVANSSRFFYQALLVAFPLLIRPVIFLYYKIRQELFHTSYPLILRAAGAVIALTAISLIVVLPVGISSLGAQGNLMFKDTQIITKDMRQVTWWIEDHVSPNDVVLSNPGTPWYIPFFTGRASLRTSYEDGSPYWLSLDDELLREQVAAFEQGDRLSQARILSEANYLVITKEEAENWPTIPFEKTLDLPTISIYKIQ